MFYNTLTVEPGIQNTENREIKVVGHSIAWRRAASSMLKGKAVFTRNI